MDGGEEKSYLGPPETLADVRFLIFVRKKTERMVTALYMVTDLLSDQEPMKWSLRHKCITLLGELLPHVKRVLASRDAEVVASRVAEIISLLEIARSAKLFSEMNAQLLHNACIELQTLLGELSQKPDLDHRMLEVSDPRITSAQEKRHSQTTQSDINDTTSMSNRMSFRSEMSHKENKVGQKNNSGGFGRKERQGQIISLLRKEGRATMTDIKNAINGVSDKTLQRDVADLVSEGFIERSGSKRWTSYSLV